MVQVAPLTDPRAAYQAAKLRCYAADEAWSVALRTAFGRDACNRRYDWDKSAHPAGCRALGVVARRASADMQAAWRVMQDAEMVARRVVAA